MTESFNPAGDDVHPDDPGDEPTALSDDSPQPEEDAAEPAAPGLTGHPGVDEAVRAVLELGDRPVEEHVEVFEQTHAALRAALSDAASGAAPQGQAPRPGQGQAPRPTPPGPRPPRP